MKRYLPFLIIAAVLITAVGATAILYRSERKEAASQNLATRPLTVASTPRPVLPGADPPHAKGAPDAPLAIEEFGDFQCPPCGMFFKDMKKIEAEYGPKMRFVFRNFPLTHIHNHALAAARAAEAAGLQGHFWEMYEQLYEHQADWSKATDAAPLFVTYARSLGLDIERFQRDMEGMQTQTRVQLDYRRGESLGVTGTPTVFLNGREIKLSTFDDFRATLNAELKNKSQ